MDDPRCQELTHLLNAGRKGDRCAMRALLQAGGLRTARVRLALRLERGGGDGT